VKLQGKFRRKYAIWAAASLSVTSLALTPIFMPAMAANARKSVLSAAKSGLDIFTPAGVDSRLAAKQTLLAVSTRELSRFPFTPAGVELPQSRTMTVAARTTAPIIVRAVNVRSAIASLQPGNGSNTALLPSNFSLTASRGWQGFALNAAPKLAPTKPMGEIGKSSFKLDDTAKPKPSRFNTAVKIAPNVDASSNQRKAVTSGDYSLDVGTSFSIAKGVAVTAGVAYKSERDRIAPTQENVKDSEAVYVGTKIRF
jgi:hypothetical protein